MTADEARELMTPKEKELSAQAIAHLAARHEAIRQACRRGARTVTDEYVYPPPADELQADRNAALNQLARSGFNVIRIRKGESWTAQVSW